MNKISFALLLVHALLASIACFQAVFVVEVDAVDALPVLSSVDGTSTYQQIMNPTWVQPSKGTNFKEGILTRSQNCSADVGGECVFCGGSEDKASVLAFSERHPVSGVMSPVTEANLAFGPSDDSDSWGTEDPRMVYDSKDELYYMFYTAYNGVDIDLSLATSATPLQSSSWTRHGPVFPDEVNTKSGAMILRNSPPHFLFWGDHAIRVTTSDDPLVWPSTGNILIETREDNFDSQLVESGPPPLLLSTGDYLFFYNSANLGWPDEPNTAYHVGWLILSGEDPSVVLQRSDKPLLTPEYAYQTGKAPYTCNVPNVVFLEAASPVHGEKDVFRVYFGAADAAIGTAIIRVSVE